MKAAVIYQPGDIKVIEKEVPTPKEGEVLIRIHACGVCGTDHSLYVGGFPASFPVVIGHEFAGEIVACDNAVKHLSVGQRVTADPNRVCRRCEYCQPCPAGVMITVAMGYRIVAARMSPAVSVEFCRQAMESVKLCDECGVCLERCPYELPIQDMLKRNYDLYEKHVADLR